MKKCQYCAEEIKDEAVKCKHCKSDLENDDTKEDNKHKKLAISSLILGVLSMFLGSIGIVPLIALVVTVIALFKIKEMKTSHKVLTVIGFILALIYSINFFLVFSSIGPNILGISYQDGVYNKQDTKQKSDYHKISGMRFNESKNVISWGFKGQVVDAEHIKREDWGCYRSCNIIVGKNKNKGAIFKDKISKEGQCQNKYSLSTRKQFLLLQETMDNKEVGWGKFCAKISCSDGKESNWKCWRNWMDESRDK